MAFEPIPGVRVIGIGHKARQGKDTTADAIRSMLRGCEKMSFADDLRSVARVMFGMKQKDARLLQALGTDVFRKKDEDVWVKSLYWKLMEFRPKYVVIPDVRFENEARFIKELDGILIKVVRVEPGGSIFIDPNRAADHPSEIALDNWPSWDHEIIARSGWLSVIRAEAEKILWAERDKFGEDF